ncbi:MAG: hypothetical protein J5626_04455 [Lachnospiraceae bacterium]|nr:hypothetical protein [Lachnospiraceae bacterium]
MKKSYLGKISVTVVAALCFLLQGCFEDKPVEWVDPNASTSTSVVQAEKVDSTEVSESVSVSVQDASESTEASTEEPVKEPEEKEERPEGLFLKLVQSESPNPITIELYEDGSYIYYDKNEPDTNIKGEWNYSSGSIGLADTSIDELVVNEFTLEAEGFSYVAAGSSGFAVGEVKDKDFFFDGEKVITDEELTAAQSNLGGAPFHVRMPSRYLNTDNTFLGKWHDADGMLYVNVSKASAEVGGYSFNMKDALGTELASGYGYISGGTFKMDTQKGVLEDISVSAAKADKGIAVTLEGSGLVAYGVPAGEKLIVELTR